MRPSDGDQWALLHSPHYGTYVRVSIDGTLVSDVIGYNPWVSGQIAADLDKLVTEASMRLHLVDSSRGAGTNLSPYFDGGAQLDGRPLFDSGRYILIETAVVAPGVLPSTQWIPAFYGRIDVPDPAAEEDDLLTVRARDVCCDLLDPWLEPPYPARGIICGDQTVDLVLQQLYSLMGALPNVALKFPLTIQGAPNLYIPKFAQEPMSALEAMRRAGLQNGWDLRGRWLANTAFGGFQLVYYDPERDLEAPATVHDVIEPSQYFVISNAPKDRSGVRNVIVIIPADEARVPVITEDTTSQQLYGRGWMEVAEDRSSHIISPEDAAFLGAYILSDLKDPKVGIQIGMPYRWDLEINDRLLIQPDGIHFNTAQKLAVSGYTHDFAEDGDATTSVNLRQRPAAANEEWRRGQPTTNYVSVLPPSGPAIEGALWLQVESIDFPTL